MLGIAVFAVFGAAGESVFEFFRRIGLMEVYMILIFVNLIILAFSNEDGIVLWRRGTVGWRLIIDKLVSEALVLMTVALTMVLLDSGGVIELVLRKHGVHLRFIESVAASFLAAAVWGDRMLALDRNLSVRLGDLLGMLLNTMCRGIVVITHGVGMGQMSKVRRCEVLCVCNATVRDAPEDVSFDGISFMMTMGNEKERSGR